MTYPRDSAFRVVPARCGNSGCACHRARSVRKDRFRDAVARIRLRYAGYYAFGYRRYRTEAFGVRYRAYRAGSLRAGEMRSPRGSFGVSFSRSRNAGFGYARHPRFRSPVGCPGFFRDSGRLEGSYFRRAFRRARRPVRNRGLFLRPNETGGEHPFSECLSFPNRYRVSRPPVRRFRNAFGRIRIFGSRVRFEPNVVTFSRYPRRVRTPRFYPPHSGGRNSGFARRILSEAFAPVRMERIRHGTLFYRPRARSVRPFRQSCGPRSESPRRRVLRIRGFPRRRQVRRNAERPRVRNLRPRPRSDFPPTRRPFRGCVKPRNRRFLVLLRIFRKKRGFPVSKPR